MYKDRSTTNSWVMIFRIKPTDGPEKIVHIPHCCRLFKLASFIFYIYKDNPDNSNFEFFYFESESKSYGGYSLFRIPHKEIPLPPGVGNMKHGRIDSAFFFNTKLIGLRIDNKTQEYEIKYLQMVHPKKGRKYPFVET